MKPFLQSKAPVLTARRTFNGEIHEGKIFYSQGDRLVALIEYDDSWNKRPWPDCFKLFNLKGELLDTSATYKRMKLELVPKYRRALLQVAEDKRFALNIKSLQRIVKDKLLHKIDQSKGRSR